MDQRIDAVLAGTKTIAVVGISDKPDRPSHQVAKYLKERGYRVIPVNPLVAEVLGEKAYKSLSEIPDRVDLVDVFRKSSDVPPIAEEAVRAGQASRGDRRGRRPLRAIRGQHDCWTGVAAKPGRGGRVTVGRRKAS